MAKKYPLLSKVLKKLLFDRDMKPVELARAVDMPIPTIHRLVTGKSTRPYQNSIEALAKYFEVTQEQLLGEKPLPGEKSEPKTQATKKKQPISENYIKQIPLVPWDKIITLDIEKNSYDTIPCLGTISEQGFATIMQDSSMSPVFAKGNILIFDPAKASVDRSFVLVKLSENNALVFRQILVDVDYKYLKPLNPDLTAFKMRLLNEADQVIGVLVESRQIYNDDISLGGPNV